MKLDRNHQLKILEYLRDYYHCPADARVNEQSFFHNEDYLMNLKYLYEYGLIKGYESKVIGKRGFSLGGVEITAKGLDLLEDDGGVGAILRTVVVKFDAENIRRIMKEKVLLSAIPNEQKTSLVEKIKNFSGKALETITLKLLEKGLDDPSILSVIFGSQS
jgi:hypothetical protein